MTSTNHAHALLFSRDLTATSTAASSPCSDAADGKPGGANKKLKSTAAYLEDLSIRVMRAHTTNGEDWMIKEHFSDDFEMVDTSIHNCPVPSANNLEQHMANREAFKRMYPDWQVLPWNATANLVKGSNSAEVWVSVRGCDHPDSAVYNRESVSVLYWRKQRTDGKWVCYRHSSIRGPGDWFE